MGCDYCIFYNCKYRQRYDENYLNEILKLERFLREKSISEIEKTSISHSILGANSETKKEYDKKELKLIKKVINEMDKGECINCKFNIFGGIMGCKGYLNYPIAGLVEDIIVMFIQEYAKNLNNYEESLLFKKIVENHINSSKVIKTTEFRRLEGIRMFFNYENSQVFEVPLFPGSKVNIDWFWDEFLFNPELAEMIGNFGRYSDEQFKIVGDFASRLAAYIMQLLNVGLRDQVSPEDFQKVGDFTRFLKATLIAYENNMPLLISP